MYPLHPLLPLQPPNKRGKVLYLFPCLLRFPLWWAMAPHTESLGPPHGQEESRLPMGVRGWGRGPRIWDSILSGWVEGHVTTSPYKRAWGAGAGRSGSCWKRKTTAHCPLVPQKGLRPPNTCRCLSLHSACGHSVNPTTRGKCFRAEVALGPRGGQHPNQACAEPLGGLTRCH